jgi:hypothetical protein
VASSVIMTRPHPDHLEQLLAVYPQCDRSHRK